MSITATPRVLSLPTSPSGTSFTSVYHVSIGSEVTEECARLFSSNYGIWGAKATDVSKYTKPGMWIMPLLLSQLPRSFVQASVLR